MSMTVDDRNLLLPPNWNTYSDNVRRSLNLAITEVTKESSASYAILEGCDIRWFFLLFEFERPCYLRFTIYRFTPDIHGEVAMIEELRRE